MTLSQDIKSFIKLHAKNEAPEECCGFILNDSTACKANNSSQNKSQRFSISAEDYLQAARLGKITAIYHSHPSTEATFSEYDKFNSINHNLIYVLYSLKDNSFSQFDPSLSSFNEYVGRNFDIGKTDCFGLMRDFYKAELNINLNNYKRDQDWKTYLSELFDKRFKTEGFEEVSQLQKYDCILFKSKKNGPSSHIAVYLGDGLMLHQPQKSFSRIEEYSERHKKLTNKIIRHNELN